ncbi:MAG: hypothetical protein R3335_00940 [Anaerolineales bacterium]|nr:hypothetical protein [Anaerolineales bacterium]
MEDTPQFDEEPPIQAEVDGASASSEQWNERYEQWKPYLWQGKLGPAFWTVAGVFSIGLNIILIIILVILGQELFNLKELVNNQLIGGLYENFVAMDEAVISTTIAVDDTIPVQFELPVSTSTSVVLTQDTLLEEARVDLVTGGLRITDAPTSIILKAGTSLPVNLNIQVPVDTEIPIHLEVPVRIPLKETELHAPFVGLQEVIGPYNDLLGGAPDSWDEALCPEGSGIFCLFANP